MTDFKHSEQPRPDSDRPYKKYRISYFAYENSRSKTPIRAYRILWAENIFEAKQKMDIWPPLVYDVSEI